jgi:hypothetical protein
MEKENSELKTISGAIVLSIIMLVIGIIVGHNLSYGDAVIDVQEAVEAENIAKIQELEATIDALQIDVFAAFDDGYELAMNTTEFVTEQIKDYEQAFNAGYQEATESRLLTYSTGWDNGKEYGYNSGYDVGYDDGLEAKDIELFELAYNRGYQDAEEIYGYQSASAWDDAYWSGFNDGYNSGVEDIYDPFALGEYTMTFRDFNNTVPPVNYTGNGEIRMLTGDKLIHKGDFPLVGEMNSVCIVDFHNPEGELIAVGGLFGINLDVTMQPLTKP